MTVEVFIIGAVVVFAWISLLTAAYFSTRELVRASRAAIRVSLGPGKVAREARKGRTGGFYRASPREGKTLLLPVVSRRG